MPTIQLKENKKTLNKLFHSLNNEVLMLSESYLSKFIEGDLYNKDTMNFVPYEEIGDKAVIHVFGVLLHAESYAEYEGYYLINTYSRIRADFDKALNNPHIKKIYFHFDSGGGHAAGCFDLVDYIYDHRGDKPIYALVDENCYSGAYALASACDKIICPRTGGVGSVGVITHHYDYSKFFEGMGINIETIKAGEMKDSGSPYKPLSDIDRSRIQESIDSTYDLFVKTVARNRGISEQAVRETEADIFDSHEAIQIGLIDYIAPVREFFETEKTNGEYSMPTNLNADENSVSQATESLTSMLGLTSKKVADKAISNVKDIMAKQTQEKLDAQKEELTTQFEADKATAVEAAKKEAVAETISINKQIFEACKTAGRTDIAGQYMAEGLTLEQAQEKLTEQQASEDETTPISTNINPTTETIKNNKVSPAVEKINKRRNGGK